jgi:hypothetical protein
VTLRADERPRAPFQGGAAVADGADQGDQPDFSLLNISRASARSGNSFTARSSNGTA